MSDNKGQMSIFIIMALIIVAGVLVYIAVKYNSTPSKEGTDFDSVFSYYSSCIEDKVRAAIDIAGSQGGHIYTPEYLPGSEHAPFSSQLNFLGFPVPYWYYVSANGIIKEQVPTEESIERDIARYVEERIDDCDFNSFYEKGFSIETSGAKTKVFLENNEVRVFVDSELKAEKEENVVSKREHKVIIKSKLGKFYEIAREIYDKQKNEAFLENYSVDVLRLYAPVDGVEASCNSKVWKSREVSEQIKEGLEANIAFLKMKGDYYDLKEGNSYFVVDKDVSEPVNFIYSKEWPTKIEITGADGEIMIANPIGNQNGLGTLGFCYAPYHFVYDLSFPVLIQIHSGDELFQFPVGVIIENNVPREAVFSEIEENIESDICEFATQEIDVRIYDEELKEVDGDVSYSCFDQICSVGKSSGGRILGNVPSCVNGYVEVRAENFSEKRQVFSSNKEKEAKVILQREYEVEVEVEAGGEKIEKNTIVTFSGEETKSIALPESNKIRISEGSYNISVHVYGSSGIVIPKSKSTKCVDVRKSGFLGIFGGIKEKCYDIDLPETKIENALVAGGSEEHYILESELENGKIKLRVGVMPKPNSLEQLQYNYESFEKMGVEIDFA